MTPNEKYLGLKLDEKLLEEIDQRVYEMNKNGEYIEILKEFNKKNGKNQQL